MLGSIVVWLFGTLSCMYFLVWFISSPEGDPNPETSTTAIFVVAVIALADVLLCMAAGKPLGAAVVRVSVIAVIVLALAGLLVLPSEASYLPVAFVVLSFLVPTLAYALVLPVALSGRRDLRAAAISMACITVAFLTAFVVQSASDAKMWISFADLDGAFATGVLAVLLLGARAAKERTATSLAESLETTPSEARPSSHLSPGGDTVRRD
jgi:hypothetical protein